MVFEGVTKFNRLQSWVFNCAYNTDNNMLVCAPTGAGKTNVALLTILHEIKKIMEELGVIRREEMKIIYVAPMKALAQEIVAKFTERLGRLGLIVRELTGDMQLTRQEIAETQVIVTTPEKWDVITRKGGDNTLVEKVKLLILDEVHLLASDRGNVIESITARTLRQVLFFLIFNLRSNPLRSSFVLSVFLPHFRTTWMLQNFSMSTWSLERGCFTAMIPSARCL